MTSILDGLKLMLVGMGMVFSFLTVMILWVLMSARLSVKFAHLLPDDVKPAPRRKAKPAAAQSSPAGNDQSLLAAAVGAAVQAYRNDRDKR